MNNNEYGIGYEWLLIENTSISVLDNSAKIF